MPLPSQVASGRSNFRDYLIDFNPTERDFDYYSAFVQTRPETDIGYLSIVLAHEWKVSLTPSGYGELPWLSLTCKKPGAYLQGFTVSPRGIGLELVFSFSAWLVDTVATLLADDVDGFLTYGSGWVSNSTGNGKNSRTEDEIPF
jgi:hypothetical protein